ncbi:hypothetical protein EMPS_00584 [Entomortierella parvispora]|uniref:Uncharacterized protein n=1 Tax=Entomortierella parvispora TaxID=205924 RepID=A0A9P3H166_9FUNG|nr:hypothetical protein EMPS_00584 [Entomortierella parvispora]
MSHTMSSSFNYTTDVVDFEAMNITEMFPEASSFSFDMSSNYNHSYTDSISGVPLSQQALWDDGQLSLQPSDTSRVFALTPLSSLNNSANNSINLGHQQATSSSRHLLVPPSHHGAGGGRQQHPLSQQQSYSSSPLGSDGQMDSDSGDYDDESSLQQGWVDETRDQNGIMLLSDKEHKDEQHLLFLQDIGAGSLSRGDSLSLFANLEDDELSCDLFNEKLDIMDTSGPNISSRSPLRIDTGNGNNSNRRSGIENEIFDQEFMASLKTPLFAQAPPPLESATKKNFFAGLHTITAPSVSSEDDSARRKEGGEAPQKHGSDAYQTALKSFLDSLKVADPIKTPHKFAPQPLPILWNEPKIRSKALPSFSLADYKDMAKTLPPLKPFPHSGTAGTTTTVTTASNKFGSLSSSPTNTHSTPVSAQSSPMSSISASPPTGIDSRLASMPMTPTTPTANSMAYLQAEKRSQQQAQLPKPELTPTNERVKRPSSIQNPHLAFDPTIPPSEKDMEGQLESRSGKVTLERRHSQLQEPKVRAQTDASGTVRRSSSPPPAVLPDSGSTAVSGLRGPVVRKRRSLHQDMFFQDQANNVDSQDMQQSDPQNANSTQIPRRASRPSSMNILPESLTAVNNNARPDSVAQDRARRLSEEEGEQSRIPGSLSLGRTIGSRFARSGSGSTLDSPTTPTAANIYGTFSGRARQGSRPSAYGTSPPLGAETGLQSKSKLPSPGTHSRGGSRSSPLLTPLTGIGRNTLGHDGDSRKFTGLPSPTDYYEDDYKPDIPSHRVQATPIRTQFQYQGRQESNVKTPEWQDSDGDLMEAETPKARVASTLIRRTSLEIQKEQRHQQRLRIQQQAQEDRYAYNDNDDDDAEDYMNAFPQPPPRDQLTGRRTLPLSGSNPTQSRFQDPSSRRSSKDSSPTVSSRVSPPLPSTPTTPRRPLSTITNTTASRRLSNTANVGVPSYNGSASALPPPMAGSGLPLGRSATLHGRSTSSGSATISSTPLYSPSATSAGSQRYSSLGRASTIPASLSDDTLQPRRPLTSSVSTSQQLPARRASGIASSTIPPLGAGNGMGSGRPGLSSTGSIRRASGIPSSGYSSGSLISPSSSNNSIASSNGVNGLGITTPSSRRSNSASSESEYARVFVPPSRISTLPSSNFTSRSAQGGMSMSQDFGYGDNGNSNSNTNISHSRYSSRETIRRGNDLLDYSVGAGDYESSPAPTYRHSTVGSGMSYGGAGNSGNGSPGSAYTYTPVAPARKSSLNALAQGSLAGNGMSAGGSVGRHAGGRSSLAIRSGLGSGGGHGSLADDNQYNPNQFMHSGSASSGSALPSLQRSATTTGALRSGSGSFGSSGGGGNRSSQQQQQIYQPAQYRSQLPQQQQPYSSQTQLQQPRYSYQASSQRY